jgi:hypothetical protein
MGRQCPMRSYAVCAVRGGHRRGMAPSRTHTVSCVDTVHRGVWALASRARLDLGAFAVVKTLAPPGAGRAGSRRRRSRFSAAVQTALQCVDRTRRAAARHGDAAARRH